jgi:hypothetical protein
MKIFVKNVMPGKPSYIAPRKLVNIGKYLIVDVSIISDAC